MINKTFMKRLQELNIPYKTYDIGIMIDLERIINNTAIAISKEENASLMKLIKRYKLDYEYRGYYTALLIKDITN